MSGSSGIMWHGRLAHVFLYEKTWGGPPMPQLSNEPRRQQVNRCLKITFVDTFGDGVDVARGDGDGDGAVPAAGALHGARIGAAAREDAELIGNFALLRDRFEFVDQRAIRNGQ